MRLGSRTHRPRQQVINRQSDMNVVQMKRLQSTTPENQQPGSVPCPHSQQMRSSLRLVYVCRCMWPSDTKGSYGRVNRVRDLGRDPT